MKFSFINLETKRRNTFFEVKEIKETSNSIKIYDRIKMIEIAKNIIGEYNIELDLQN